MTEDQWTIFRGCRSAHGALANLPLPPPWRKSTVTKKPVPPTEPTFDLEFEKDRGEPVEVTQDVRRAVNAALVLRRPLLVTGKPGVGKSSLAYAVSYELRMGPVLKWSITSRSAVKGGLYDYDAVGRLQGGSDAPIGDFLRLGPLGSALYPTTWPRTLLIDEIDKGDIDLPNDLLNVLEDGYFEIPELARAREPRVEVKLHGSDQRVPIENGRVDCAQFPFIVMTSNGEREFPAPFLRRCIRITIPQPDDLELTRIVNAHLSRHLTDAAAIDLTKMIGDFLKLREKQELATDQLLNAVFVVLGDGNFDPANGERGLIVDLLLKQLSTPQST